MNFSITKRLITGLPKEQKAVSDLLLKFVQDVEKELNLLHARLEALEKTRR